MNKCEVDEHKQWSEKARSQRFCSTHFANNIWPYWVQKNRFFIRFFCCCMCINMSNRQHAF